MKVQIEAQERARAGEKRARGVRFDCSRNAVAPISRDSRAASAALVVSYYSEFEKYDFASAFIKWAYVRTHVQDERTRLPADLLRALSRAYRGRQPRIASINRKFQSNYAVIIISHVIENTSHQRAFLQ